MWGDTGSLQPAAVHVRGIRGMGSLHKEVRMGTRQRAQFQVRQSNLWWFNLKLFNFYSGTKPIRSVGTVLQILNCDLFLGQLYTVRQVLFGYTGQWQGTAACQPGAEGEQPIRLQPFCTQTPFCFSLAVHLWMNYPRHSIFYYKTDFVLDDFA